MDQVWWIIGFSVILMVWLYSFIGFWVAIGLITINMGSGYEGWEKRFWRNVCKKEAKKLLLYFPLFIIANYSFYILVIN